MEIEKIISFVTQYLSDYWWFFTETLKHPTLRFSLLKPLSKGTPDIALVSSSQENKHSRLDPRLLGFMAISIFIGATINELIPGRAIHGLSFTTIFTATAAVWFCYSFVLHLFCKLFKGQGIFEETLGVSLQLFSVIYVISSLCAFIGGLILTAVSNRSITTFAVTSSSGLINHARFPPIYLFFYVEFILLIFYLPIAIKYVHHFGWIRQVTIGIISSIAFVFLSQISYSFAMMLAFGPLLVNPEPMPEFVPFPFRVFVETEPSVVGGTLLGILTGLLFIGWLIKVVKRTISNKAKSISH